MGFQVPTLMNGLEDILPETIPGTVEPACPVSLSPCYPGCRSQEKNITERGWEPEAGIYNCRLEPVLGSCWPSQGSPRMQKAWLGSWGRSKGNKMAEPLQCREPLRRACWVSHAVLPLRGEMIGAHLVPYQHQLCSSLNQGLCS